MGFFFIIPENLTPLAHEKNCIDYIYNILYCWDYKCNVYCLQFYIYILNMKINKCLLMCLIMTLLPKGQFKKMVNSRG